MNLSIIASHAALVLLLGVLFGVAIMCAFVCGEVFAIAAIETIEGRGPLKWLWSSE